MLMILVSGATGTAGKEIVLQLASLGILTKALVRDMAKATPFRGKCVHVAVGDLNEPTRHRHARTGREKPSGDDDLASRRDPPW